MIDFTTYEEVKLEDVAEYGRAKKDKIYPSGTTTLQISATRGQIGYLEKPSKVHTKDVAIIPQAGINPRYFNVVMKKNIAEFMRKYATGINIQEKEVGKFPIQLHDVETQKAVADLFGYVEREEAIIKREISNLKTTKSTLMNKMFV